MRVGSKGPLLLSGQENSSLKEVARIPTRLLNSQKQYPPRESVSRERRSSERWILAPAFPHFYHPSSHKEDRVIGVTLFLPCYLEMAISLYQFTVDFAPTEMSRPQFIMALEFTLLHFCVPEFRN